MLALKKIAITGGISSGKSTVCRILKEHGAYQVNSDDIVHRLISQDSACIQQIVALLGSEVLVDGKVDRKKIAKQVFRDREKLIALEAILHPRLFEEIEKEYKRAQKQNKYTAFVAEIPLIQEIGRSSEFDVIVAVICDEVLAKKRFVQEGFTQEDYDRRMSRQWNQKEKANKADFTLTNNGTLEEFEQEVKKLITLLT